jgi:hypothetical protein
MFKPGRNMLVSGVRAVRVAPEEHVWARRHNRPSQPDRLHSSRLVAKMILVTDKSD